MSRKKRPVHPVFAELRRRRIDLRWRQWEVAERVGVTTHTISTWEKGFSTPSWFMASCWAQALGIEVTWKETRNGQQ